MRGPGLRVLCDVRRTWQCPRCGYSRRAAANETSVRCQCQKDEPLMKLVEGQRYAKPTPQPLDLSWEYIPDPHEVPSQALTVTPAVEIPAVVESTSHVDEATIEVRSAEAHEEPFDDSDDSDETAEETDVTSEVADQPGTTTPKKKKKRRRRKPRPPQADGGQ